MTWRPPAWRAGRWLGALQTFRGQMAALDAARPHVWRQAHHGRHEQDRWDAYVWWQTWGGPGQIYPIPKNPNRKDKTNVRK